MVHTKTNLRGWWRRGRNNKRKWRIFKPWCFARKSSWSNLWNHFINRFDCIGFIGYGFAFWFYKRYISHAWWKGWNYGIRTCNKGSHRNTSAKRQDYRWIQILPQYAGKTDCTDGGIIKFKNYTYCSIRPEWCEGISPKTGLNKLLDFILYI